MITFQEYLQSKPGSDELYLHILALAKTYASDIGGVLNPTISVIEKFEDGVNAVVTSLVWGERVRKYIYIPAKVIDGIIPAHEWIIFELKKLILYPDSSK